VQKPKAKLSPEAAELRRSYKRTWAAMNRDKVREYNNRYWERKAQEVQQEGSR